MTNVEKKWLILDTLVILILGIISTVVPFTEHFFNVSVDGIYHFARFQQIADSLRIGEIPEVLNFKYVPGNSVPGVAINSAYPWITGLIFIIPNIIFHNPIWGLALGFLILNVITIISIKQLLSYISNNIWAIYSGVIIYQFNNYHFIDLYSRVAIGESLAYAFLPLVVLGLLKINKNDKRGFITLGLAMALIINSHVLTFVFALCIVIVYGLYLFAYKLIFRKQNVLQICLNITKAGILGIILGGYSVYNIAYIYVHNSIVGPPKGISPLDANTTLASILNNSISEHIFYGWNFGLPITSMIVILGIWSLFGKTKNYKKIFITTMLFYSILFAWIPFNLLKDSPLGTVQFLGRFLIIVILMFSIGICLFVSNQTLRKDALIIINMSIILFSVFALFNNHNEFGEKNAGHVKINSNNYYKILETNVTFAEFLPKEYLGPRKEILEDKKIVKIKNSKYNNNSVTYIIDSKENKNIIIPVVLYKGFNYELNNNGRVKVIKSTHMIKTSVKKGENHIIVKSINNKHKYMLLISLLGLFIICINICWYKISYLLYK